MSHQQRDITGWAIVVLGAAFGGFHLYTRGDLTSVQYLVSIGLIVFGGTMTAPRSAKFALDTVSDLAEKWVPHAVRAGRRDTDPVAVPITEETPIVGAVVVAQSSRPLQPEIAQRPADFRPPAGAAAPMPNERPKRVRKPKAPPEQTPEGEEFGAEQIDAADVPEKHEAADYRPLGFMAMPEPGQGDKRVGKYFVLGEFTVSGSHPELVVPVPAKLVPQVVRLASTILDPIRTFVGKAVTVLSGYRAKKLNAAVGGSPTSQHVYAAAADFTCDGVHLVFEAMVGGSLSVPVGQCIYYPSKRFIHVSLPGWRYRSPTFQVHEPSKGLRYRTVNNIKELRELVGAA